MYYFKPPGSRGQALHQDNYYLMVRPGTCIAAWTAIDDCDEENGGMMVVPGSHRIDLACPGSANPKVSFTKDYVPVPKGLKAQMMRMKAGDTLFFNGTVIHGSGPNRSKNRFRRSFICHYAGGSTEHISRYFNPMITMAGGGNLHQGTVGRRSLRRGVGQRDEPLSPCRSRRPSVRRDATPGPARNRRPANR